LARTLLLVFICQANAAAISVLGPPLPGPDRSPWGIHIGLTDDPHTSAVVSWFTRDPLTSAPTVSFQLVGFGSGTEARGKSYDSDCLGGIYYHEVVLEDLAPGSKYEVLPRHGVDPEHSVVVGTFGAPVDSLVVTLYGDQGTRPAAERIALAVAEVDADLHLHLGDLSYANGDPALWDRWFEIIEPIAMDRPYLVLVGNHEREAGWGTSGYDRRFAMPGAERYYSMRRGPLALVVLDGEHVSGAEGWRQATWAEQVLAEWAADPSIGWIVAALHRPLYSSSFHGGDLPLRTYIEPLLLEYGVDLVLAGHDHNYERSYPVIDGVPQSSEAHEYLRGLAPIHIVSGGGGGPLYASGWSDHTVHSQSTYHFLRLVVRGSEQLEVQAISSFGEQLDWCRINAE